MFIVAELGTQLGDADVLCEGKINWRAAARFSGGFAAGLALAAAVWLPFNTARADGDSYDPPLVKASQTKRTLGASFVDTFEDGHDDTKWYISDFVVSDGIFKNRWSKKNVKFTSAGEVTLSINRARSGPMPYSAGEYQNKDWTRYGRYEAIMKAAPGSGIVTGFFTYTGPYFEDPHDEIDIEFLGNRRDIIQFNVFTDGLPLGGQQYRLPYDASREYHLYAFDWQPDRVTWYIDGVKIYELTSEQFEIPQTPQRLIAQVWTGEYYKWHGHPRFHDGARAAIRCMSYSRSGDDKSPRCADRWDLMDTNVKPIRNKREVRYVGSH